MLKYASQLKSSLLSASAAIVFFASSSVFSQVQVLEAGAENSNPTQSNSQNRSSAGGGNEIIVTLYNIVEALQREVQTLRGLVEEQTYQIRRMENEQRDRYLDIDNRLSELSQRMSLGVNGIESSTPQVLVSTNVIEIGALETAAQTALSSNLNNTAISAETELTFPAADNINSKTTIVLNEISNLEPKSEVELYQNARNLLLNDGEFEASISVFQQMIEDYPQGRLAPNAYYWQGEALILVDRFPHAINVFNQVVDDFPMHEKAPDSMLKLGIVYSLMENERLAQRVWRELLEDYADSASASLRLAEVYLREGYNR